MLRIEPSSVWSSFDPLCWHLAQHKRERTARCTLGQLFLLGRRAYNTAMDSPEMELLKRKCRPSGLHLFPLTALLLAVCCVFAQEDAAHTMRFHVLSVAYQDNPDGWCSNGGAWPQRLW